MVLDKIVLPLGQKGVRFGCASCLIEIVRRKL